MKKRFLLFSLSILCALEAHASYSQDTGRITELFTNSNGQMAIRLDGGFPNAVKSGQCSGADGTWAGNLEASKEFKGSLLAAKMAGSTVVVTIEGCAGTWFKIIDMYIK